MKKFWVSIKSYLTFLRGERNATAILLVTLVLVIIMQFLLSSIISSDTVPDAKLIERADSFFLTLKYHPPEREIEPVTGIIAELPAVKKRGSFTFDPNTISVDSLIELGLSQKQAEVFVKYRMKGGIFRSPDDLDRIYVLDSSLLLHLKPLVRIVARTDSVSSNLKIEEPLRVELNSADTLSLIRLKGIGKTFAKRITNYRALLGGFYSTDQLLEVYGITPQVYEQISSSVWVDQSKIRKINVNLVRFEELKVHPYISEYQAKAITYYRTQKGVFSSLDEIWKNKLMPKDRFLKLEPYLTLE